MAVRHSSFHFSLILRISRIHFCCLYTNIPCYSLIVLHTAFFYTSIGFYKIFGFHRIKYVYFGHLESYLRIYQWNLIAVLLFYIHCYTIFYFLIFLVF